MARSRRAGRRRPRTLITDARLGLASRTSQARQRPAGRVGLESRARESVGTVSACGGARGPSLRPVRVAAGPACRCPPALCVAHARRLARGPRASVLAPLDARVKRRRAPRACAGSTSRDLATESARAARLSAQVAVRYAHTDSCGTSSRTRRRAPARERRARARERRARVRERRCAEHGAGGSRADWAACSEAGVSRPHVATQLQPRGRPRAGRPGSPAPLLRGPHRSCACQPAPAPPRARLCAASGGGGPRAAACVYRVSARRRVALSSRPRVAGARPSPVRPPVAAPTAGPSSQPLA